MFIAHPSVVRILTFAAALLATSGHGLRADDALRSEPRKVLAESAGESVARNCTLPNCATVIAIRHPYSLESPASIPVQGPLKRNPPFGAYDPHVPPINQPSFLVQKQRDYWLVEVQRRDGTVQVIRQSYPALFQVGDEVLVEGEHVRIPD